jgi:hypothetical protein
MIYIDILIHFIKKFGKSQLRDNTVIYLVYFIRDEVWIRMRKVGNIIEKSPKKIIPWMCIIIWSP